MKRSKLNKEDVYQQFGWKPEDGDYIVHHVGRNKSKFQKQIEKIINRFKKTKPRKVSDD
ncbi:MAG: hypothetical protein WC644_08315 [Ignavibacteria bacterium]